MSLSCPAIVSPLLAHVTSSEAGGGKSQFSVLSFHRGRAGCNYFLPRTGSAWRTKCPHQNPGDNQAGFPLQNMCHACTGRGAHIITGGQARFHTHTRAHRRTRTPNEPNFSSWLSCHGVIIPRERLICLLMQQTAVCSPAIFFSLSPKT